MNKIKLPIFVSEEFHELYMFDLESDMQHKLEAIDVSDNVYKAFDAEGRLLKLETVNEEGIAEKPTEGRFLFGLFKNVEWIINNKNIQVTLAEETPTHVDELKKLIKKFLKSGDIETSELSLPQLIVAYRNFCNQHAE